MSIQKIKIRRGFKTDLPALDVGELAYTIDTRELFVGTPQGNAKLNRHVLYEGEYFDVNSFLAELEGGIDEKFYSEEYRGKQALTDHADDKMSEITVFVDDKKIELADYTDVKKSELDTHTSTKKNQLDTHTSTKESEIDSYTSSKEQQLNNYTESKKSDLNNHTDSKISELDDYTVIKEGELDSHTSTKEGEIDSYVDETVKPAVDTYAEEQVDAEVDRFLEEVNEQLAQTTQDLTDHETATMPHLIYDEDNDKTYRYGYRYKDGGMQLIYEEVV